MMVMWHVADPRVLLRIILINFGVCGSLTVNIQRLKHVLHVFELFSFQGCVNPVDHIVVSLLLLLFHFGELLEMLLTIWEKIIYNETTTKSC